LKDPKTGGNLILFNGEKEIESFFYKRDHDNKYFTIAWNIGKKQTVLIDGVSHPFMPHTILPIMFNQTFQFSQAKDIVAWTHLKSRLDGQANVWTGGYGR
ncbi:MAG TPA: hypothetical protein VFG46_16445, partial [Chryseolinea sp.]|nr:hypothetical protein [Chryseolinea sp.]